MSAVEEHQRLPSLSLRLQSAGPSQTLAAPGEGQAKVGRNPATLTTPDTVSEETNGHLEYDCNTLRDAPTSSTRSSHGPNETGPNKLNSVCKDLEVDHHLEVEVTTSSVSSTPDAVVDPGGGSNVIDSRVNTSGDPETINEDYHEDGDENSEQSLSGSIDHSDSNSDSDSFPLFFPSHYEQYGSRNVIRLSHRSESPISQESRNSVLTEYTVVDGQPIWDRLRLPCSTVVRGEAFCDCPSSPYAHRYLTCLCGEDQKAIEWTWDGNSCTTSTDVSEDGQHASFNKEYSTGTAVVRGNKELIDNQHFWEIKMTSPVYGTDMMVGIGTAQVDMANKTDDYCSFLGLNNESWGYSYTGIFYHKAQGKVYGSQFGKGSIIGLHLDTWRGTLSLYKNHEFIGVAAEGLHCKPLYPMASSTACKSTMKLINATSFSTSLQFLCCSALRRHIPDHLNVLSVLPFPPGLRDFLNKRLHWLLRARVNHYKASKGKESESSPEPITRPSEKSRPKRYQGNYSEAQDSVPSKKKCLD